MPYADSDFFLALIKENDWLNANAEKLLKKYKGSIWTSQWTIIEILMISREYNLDTEIIVGAIGQLSDIEGGVDILLSVAHMMKEKKMNTFDALHAISCSGDAIISSDSVYDKLGLNRIKLER